MALEGYKLIFDFGDPAAEAMACRGDRALFDFSFLECARLTGNRARDLIERFTGRSMATLRENEIFYALRVDSGGRITADWTVWRVAADSFDVMSGRREDVLDLLACTGPDVAVVDMTADRATFALQGPRALDMLRKLGDVGHIGLLKYFTFDHARLAGLPCTIGRLGYTGEPGFEIIAEQGQARDLWDALSAHVAAAGFIAADILRIEAGFILFSNELRLPVSPSEVGLGKFSRPLDPLEPAIKLVSFLADAQPQSWPWRPSRDLQRPSGLGAIAVTSACQSVAAGGILGLGYVLAETSPDTVLRDEAGNFRNIRLAPRPFYDTAKQRPREPWQQSGDR
jgi:glycine cleavage system T protein (aminomethyltransferase)